MFCCTNDCNSLSGNTSRLRHRIHIILFWFSLLITAASCTDSLFCWRDDCSRLHANALWVICVHLSLTVTSLPFCLFLPISYFTKKTSFCSVKIYLCVFSSKISLTSKHVKIDKVTLLFFLYSSNRQGTHAVDMHTALVIDKCFVKESVNFSFHITRGKMKLDLFLS